jgi:pyridoxal phosphate enzyme (YggS family)
MVDVKSNLRVIRQTIGTAAEKSGRSPQDIKLVAVTKTVPVEKIAEAIGAGVTDIGESRVQEAVPKITSLKTKYPHVTWHMVGHLQRNKAWQALDIFDIIQSLDSERLAREISDQRRKTKDQRPVAVLVEVNTSGEETKYGISVESLKYFLQTISSFGNIQVQGLMTVAPIVSDLETVRPYFKKLKELSDEIKTLQLPRIEMKYLSMGMSDDFEIAIEEGSNLIRIGRAIFGTRGGK